MDDFTKISALLDKYLEGTASLDEQAAIETWYLSFSLTENEVPKSLADEDMADVRKMIIRYAANSSQIRKPKVYFLWKGIGSLAAAAALIIIGVWVFNSKYQDAGNKTSRSAYSNDITPGKEGATLFLANGKQIRLTNAANGVLAEEGGVMVSKSAKGVVIYNIIDRGKATPGKMNTLSTAKGETYKIRLPDGSSVQLNAASSLKFPVTFQNSTQRKVELKGEAYFEIAKDKIKPFLVVSNNQTVEVLGTHFNINSYEDEASTKTTLIEGSVKVHKTQALNNVGVGKVKLINQEYVLTPNQQSIISKNEAKVVSVNAELTVAWTKGRFMFNDEKLESILLKISRWYNVDIIYQDQSIKDESFWGIITKYDNLSQVLNMLEKTKKVKFNIEGTNVIVNKNTNN